MTFNDKLCLSFVVKVNKASMLLPRVTLVMLGTLMVVSVVEVAWDAWVCRCN
jgi:hypothetical protein